MPDENRTGIYIDFALPARRVRELGPRESHTLCAEDSEAFASGRRTLAPDFVCQWFRYSSPPSDPVEAALSAANFPHVGDTSASRTDWSRGEPAARAPHFNVVKKKVLTFFGAPD